MFCIYLNNFHCFVIIKRMYVFVFEDHMLDWHSCQMCYPLEIKVLLNRDIIIIIVSHTTFIHQIVFKI